MLSSSDQSTLVGIMIFYALLSFVISPGLGYFLLKKKDGITYGIIFGSLVSIVLWLQYGKSMITLK